MQRLLQVRAVAAARDQPRLAVAADLACDDAELQLAAVVVVFPLDRLHRHLHAGQPAVGVHRLETRRDPGVRPQVKGAVDVAAVILEQPLAQLARREGLTGALDGDDANRLVDCVRSDRHHRAQRLGIGGGVVEGDRAAVAVADQHAILDRQSREQARQHVVGLDLHVALAGIGRPWAGLAVAGAVVDDAGAGGGVAKLLREVAPHLDTAQALVQEDECRAVEPVTFLRRKTAHAQSAVAEVDELVRGHMSDVTGTWRREKAPMAAGSTVRNRNGASSMPPTTTMASGRCTWLPIAVEKAAGNRPTQAAMQVISTGRICSSQVFDRATSRSRPSSISRLKQPTTMMPF